MLSLPKPGQMTTGVLMVGADDDGGTALNASQQVVLLLDAVTAQRARMAARRRVMSGWCPITLAGGSVGIPLWSLVLLGHDYYVVAL